MNLVSHPLPETPAHRRTRQLGYFRRASDKAMRAIDIASEQLEAAHATGEPGATASPTLDLARATRALVLATNAENRVVAGETRPRAPASDTRRPLLREALHKAADAEPNPKLRNALHRDVDDRIEDTLIADPDSEIDLTEHLFALADDLNLTLDPAKLRDELLGIESRIYPQPGSADSYPVGCASAHQPDATHSSAPDDDAPPAASPNSGPSPAAGYPAPPPPLAAHSPPAHGDMAAQPARPAPRAPPP